jgi:hypothetical protein
MPTKLAVAALLKDAKERVADNWIQHSFDNSRGGVCAMGGIAKAMREESKYDSRDHQLFDAAVNALAWQMAPHNNDSADKIVRHHDVASYNDSSFRTKKEVLEKFDAAIDCLETPEPPAQSNEEWLKELIEKTVG